LEDAVPALTDTQLKIVTTAATDVLPDRRSLFLERVAAMLTVRGRFDDGDVAKVAALAAQGLVVAKAG
jgi:hypothetical protein